MAALLASLADTPYYTALPHPAALGGRAVLGWGPWWERTCLEGVAVRKGDASLPLVCCEDTQLLMVPPGLGCSLQHRHGL